MSISSDEFSTDSENNFIGDLIAKKYLILNKLGAGAFATVWLTYNLNNDKFYAIKIQNAEDYDEGVTEVELLKKVNNTKCQFINQLIDNFIYKIDEDEHVCMVFNLMSGSIFDVIRRGKYSRGFPLSFVKDVIFQTLIALDVTHRNLKLIHTDIKPENILLQGVNNDIKNTINKTRKFNFPNTFKKNKKRCRKKGNPLRKTIDELVDYLELYNNLSDENNVKWNEIVNGNKDSIK